MTTNLHRVGNILQRLIAGNHGQHICTGADREEMSWSVVGNIGLDLQHCNREHRHTHNSFDITGIQHTFNITGIQHKHHAMPSQSNPEIHVVTQKHKAKRCIKQIMHIMSPSNCLLVLALAMHSCIIICSVCCNTYHHQQISIRPNIGRKPVRWHM